MTDKFLNKVYETTGEDATRDLYDAWAGSYDTEVGEHGYQTPARLAKAMAPYCPDLSRPMLDYGCGTGLSGSALTAAGFTMIDGADPSCGMLSEAEKTGYFRKLIELDLAEPLPFETGQYHAISAIGVISTGAGPASLMDVLMGLLPSGGLLGFSLNDHALEDEDYLRGVARLQDAGHLARVKNYGDHLPGMGIKSMIYVFEKK